MKHIPVCSCVTFRAFLRVSCEVFSMLCLSPLYIFFRVLYVSVCTVYFCMICLLFISVWCVGLIPVLSYVPHFPCFHLRALCMSVLIVCAGPIVCAGLIDWLVWIDWLPPGPLALTIPDVVLRRQGHSRIYRLPIRLLFILILVYLAVSSAYLFSRLSLFSSCSSFSLQSQKNEKKERHKDETSTN